MIEAAILRLEYLMQKEMYHPTDPMDIKTLREMVAMTKMSIPTQSAAPIAAPVPVSPPVKVPAPVKITKKIRKPKSKVINIFDKP